jgi:hypothetical protein
MLLGLPTSATLYLNQWLDIVTKGRVKLYNHVGMGVKCFTVFKCSQCQDNLHVGDNLFGDLKNPTGVPFELQEWVKEHRHVCKKFMSQYVGSIECAGCGWPYGAHEESWSQPVPMFMTSSNPNWVSYKISVGVSKPESKPQESPIQSPLPEHKGRKFR